MKVDTANDDLNINPKKTIPTAQRRRKQYASHIISP
jgi:hypothetical protein